jgi:hypothetical protein
VFGLGAILAWLVGRLISRPFGGCLHRLERHRSDRRLLTVFTAEGGKVYTVGADGKDRKELFKSTEGVNYVYVSGNSTSDPLVVLTRQTKNGVRHY